jgi:membrane protein implicated in regulation of membrane protease activity
MIEFLSVYMLWWHWLILGSILVVAEIFIPSFVTIWLGLSAIIVGFMDLYFETSFATELTVWILLSLFFVFLWFKVFKPKRASNSGQSDNSFDVNGSVIEKIGKGKKGRVKFDSPVLGDTQWYAIADEDLEAGSRVEIREVRGQLMYVKRVA